VLANQVRKSIQFARGRWFLHRPRPDDIFIDSYPKSGTTLLQMMLYQMTTSGNMDFPHIASVSPWFEYELLLGSPRNLEVPSPRVFKSHLFYHLLPKMGRFIYIMRDPRDVALSAYHHVALMNGEDPPFEWFMNEFVHGRGRFQSWYKHIASWWPHRNDPNVLFLRFEEVVADLESTVRRIAAFCGIQVREEDMPRIVEHCGIELMKKYQEKFDPRTRRISHSPASPFIRQGVVGAGREILTPEQEAILAKNLAELERKLGGPEQAPFGALFTAVRD
jgi:hypothetical protein